MGARSLGFAVAWIVSSTVAGGDAFAGEPGPVGCASGAHGAADADVEPEGPQEPEEGAVAEASVGIDVTSAYYDRGFLIEAEAFVVQPWVAVDVPLLRCRGGAVDDVRFVADFWASVQGGETGLDGGPHAPRAWYEGDVWLGVASHVRERLDVRLDYQLSWSPNGSFERFEEVALEVAYDDEAHFVARGGRFRGFAPHVILACETRGQNDDGRHLGRYLELGAEPRWSLCGEDEAVVDVSLPVRVGLSVGDYYEDAAAGDATFGYVEAAVRLTVGLDRFTSCLEGVSAVATVGVLGLGDHAAAAGDGRRSRWLATFGLAWDL